MDAPVTVTSAGPSGQEQAKPKDKASQTQRNASIAPETAAVFPHADNGGLVTPNLLVDLSNVCRDDRLGGDEEASWNRYVRVMQAWREQVNAASLVLAVADNNLIRKFQTVQDKAAYTSAVGRGEVISAPDADPVILERARETGAAVLSKDGFIGHRRKHDWIQGDAEHFWSWQSRPDGSIRILRRDMQVKGAYTMTVAAEKDERKAKNLRDTDAQDLLGRFWRCRNLSCPRSAEEPLGDPPRLHFGRILCPACREPVSDAGARPPGRGFKVLADGSEQARFSLLDRQILTLGRGDVTGVLDLSGVAVTAGKLSREHVRLEIRGGQPVATDLGSRNGTSVERWNTRTKVWEFLQPLEQGVTVTLLPRDRLVLAGSVIIEQSARSYVVAPMAR